MAILVDEKTRLVVQGITGKEGAFHAVRNRSYGTNVVAGVTPGKGGESVQGIPVFDTVAEAAEATGANTSLVFVPARFAGDAVLEGAALPLVVCVTEGVPVHGIGFVEALALFEDDPQTEAIVVIGEIGGDDEERAARFISERITKRVIAYVAGFSAPPGKRMGHAGAIITGSSGTAQAKADAFESAGVRVGRNPTEVAELTEEALAGLG